MKAIRNYSKSHPVVMFFVLTFTISWTVVYIVAGGLPVPSDQLALLGVTVLLGPSIASILMIAMTSGKDGFRVLFKHLLKWRVNIRWYLVALLTAPLSITAVLLMLSLFSPRFLPAFLVSQDRLTLFLSGIAAGLIVGFFEELGWTGFAIPRLRQRYGTVITGGVIVGLLWGAWHFILFWESDSFLGAFPLALLLARLFSCLPPYRVLMVWLFDRTDSLLLVILMHASLTASLVIIEPAMTHEELF